jgi:hypothetical protein
MNKDDGINASEDRGDRESGDFMDAIRQSIPIFAAKHERFQSWHVVEYVRDVLGIIPHDELRCLGGPFTSAHRQGLIRLHSIGPSVNPLRNKAPANWWIGA